MVGDPRFTAFPQRGLSRPEGVAETVERATFCAPRKRAALNEELDLALPPITEVAHMSVHMFDNGREFELAERFGGGEVWVAAGDVDRGGVATRRQDQEEGGDLAQSRIDVDSCQPSTSDSTAFSQSPSPMRSYTDWDDALRVLVPGATQIPFFY